MEDSKLRLERFTDKGKYVSISSDKHNIYVFFLAEQDKKLYRIICDKYLEVQSAEIVFTPNEFEFEEDMHFFRPVVNYSGDTVYSGVTIVEGETRKFEILHDVLTIHEPIVKYDKDISRFKAGKDFCVTSSLTKKQSIFFVGYDRNNGKNDPVFGELDSRNDVISKLYYMYSDSCDVHLLGLDLDVYEKRIHCVGYLIGLDGKTVYPYIESFFLRKNPFLSE